MPTTAHLVVNRRAKMIIAIRMLTRIQIIVIVIIIIIFILTLTSSMNFHLRLRCSRTYRYLQCSLRQQVLLLLLLTMQVHKTFIAVYLPHSPLPWQTSLFHNSWQCQPNDDKMYNLHEMAICPRVRLVAVVHWVLKWH